MSKILIYDDEPNIVAQLKTGIRSLNADLKPIVFIELKNLREYIYSDDNWDDVKAVIFDLAQKKEEGISNDYEILEDIKWCYENRRVPILIHSAYADELEVLKEYPSVLLFKKGGSSIKNVREAIRVLENSGFLDLFCEGPLLKDEVNHLKLALNWENQTIKNDLHASFINSFRGQNIIADLSEILLKENPKRISFLKYLSPAINSLKEL
jgi:hypothetical protein